MIMKKLFIILCVFFCIAGNRTFSQTKEDSVAIKECVLNYIEGFYQSDPVRMEKALHPELAKRAIFDDEEGNCFLHIMGKTLLIHATRQNTNDRVLNPEAEFKAEIEIYDIYGKISTVKATTNKFGFIDYCHLGKFDGEWKIINVLWEITPPPPPPGN